MKNVTKLSVFDFDGTLVNTPLPEQGREVYKAKTGKEWPHKGWWGREESMDMNIFDIKPNRSVVKDYKKQRNDIHTATIMLTGRMEKLGNKVKEILDANNLKFDGYFFNKGGSTDVEKLKTLDNILAQNPNITYVEMWDDRLTHIPIFQEWGDKKMEEGRLKDFKINVVY